MVVCIADTSSTFRRRIRNALDIDSDYEYAEVDSGAALVKRLKSDPVDIIVLTANLGDTSGLEAVRAIRDHDVYAETPIFLLARSGTHEDVLDAIEGGVTHYILLPFEDEALAEKMRTAAERVKKKAAVRRKEGYTRHQVL